MHKAMVLCVSLLVCGCFSGRSKVSGGTDLPDGGSYQDDHFSPPRDASGTPDGLRPEVGGELPAPVDGGDKPELPAPVDVGDGPELPGPVDVGDKPELPVAPDVSDVVLTDVAADDCLQCVDLQEPDLPPLLPGCCYAGADCPPDDSGAPQVCVFLDNPWFAEVGVCRSVPAEPWCWTDSQCGPGEYCHGAALCGCAMDCDMLYEGPGLCVPEDADCVPIKEEWVKEVCNAASLAFFDGTSCKHTCPGCCGCEPFCDFTYDDIGECLEKCIGDQCELWDGGCDTALPEEPWWYFDTMEGKCLSVDTCVCEGCPGAYLTNQACQAACILGTLPPDCPTYQVGWLADCPYGILPGTDGCVDLVCLAEACEGDSDCGNGEGLGGLCVHGNCVLCWNDASCPAGQVCRTGRCVEDAPSTCPEPAPCSELGCHLITPSEEPCPVCACGTYSIECEEDVECLIFSFHPFKSCVYGRCVDCRNDEDCQWGRCTPPGICYDMWPPDYELWGTWLVGWYGGLDHFSYFRFEPDGTFRRASYQSQGAWMDDIPVDLPCYPDETVPLEYPLVGTWEPEVTQSGSLVVRVHLNLPCDAGAGWTARFLVNLSADGLSAGFDNIDSDMDYMGMRVDPFTCESDFSSCDLPVL